MGVILEETGREGRWGDLRRGGGGGGVHTNSFAMIMFLCVCGSSLHASSSLLTIYGLTNDTPLLIPSV